MKNNQKEIDMIVVELINFVTKYNVTIDTSKLLSEILEELANSILSKLHKDEIVLAKSKLEFDEFSTSRFIVGDVEFYTDPKQVSELKKLEGKKIIIKVVIEDE